ncbi:MFS transporter [Asanoa sp. WMMD1127]|uniref:MFS transporter n=1 Tax=Asanoa sp. WMMD1127 TaxID=3016107 RepID=UPI0024168CB6|nr:MFS transporter [Asanoa sp. WMMD1127]MDG4824311.1 MFS transporter [Asanoa sp. WMMD1127]
MTTPSARPIRMSLLLLAYFAFISLGLPDGLLGVAWPSIAGDFKVATEAVGLLLIASTTGYFISSVAAGFTIARVGVGWLLAFSTAAASAALAGYAISPAYAVMVPFALLAGFGGGAIDSGLNAYAAAAFGAKHMNWLHAFFGLGVAIGPLIMTAVISGGLSWRWGYGIVASAQAGLALAFFVTVRRWVRHGEVGPPPPEVSVPVGDAVATAVAVKPATKVRTRETLAIPAVWLGVLAFAVYVAVEAGAGLWAFLLLTEARGVSAAVAGVCVSLYWGMLFVGRVVQGVASERVNPTKILVGSLFGMAAGALLVALPLPAWVTVCGLAVIGFAAAPVFPLLTLTTAERVGPAHADRAIGMQIGAAGLGGSLIPSGIGILMGRYGAGVLGTCLLVLSVLLIVFYGAATSARARAASRPGVASAG